MIIAVTYEDGNVFQHFGKSEQFKIYEVENNEIKSSKVVDTNGNGHGALAGFLKNIGVDTLICGGIGGGARSALGGAGIKLYPGVSGNADECVKSLLDGSLNFDENTVCSHHSHDENHSCGDHNESHSCGSHGCGNH